MIIPSSKYPAQTAVDLTNYPQGKARNVTASGSGDGTPFDKEWVNDFFGFEQALVLEAGITPSNNAETALASQLKDAIKTMIIRRQIAFYTITPGPVVIGANYPIVLAQQSGGYTVVSNGVIVPTAGSYLVTLCGELDSASTTNPWEISVTIAVAGTGASGSTGVVRRYSATIAQTQTLHKSFIVAISTPAAQPISIIATHNQTEFSNVGLLQIDRLS